MIDTNLANEMAAEVADSPDAIALVHAVCSRGYALVPVEIINKFPEINPSNYDHDDACALNAWGIELVNSATM